MARIDFLKIDCEGSEGAILRSARPECLRRIGKLSMEYHNNVSELRHDAMAALLEEQGCDVRVRECDANFGYIYARNRSR